MAWREARTPTVDLRVHLQIGLALRLCGRKLRPKDVVGSASTSQRRRIGDDRPTASNEGYALSDERSAGEVDRKLGARIRGRRLELGMSQESLADVLGITFQQIQKYEKGINRIAASRLIEISTALDFPVSAMFAGLQSGKRRPAHERDAGEALAIPGAAELVTLYAAIKSTKVRRRILDLVRAMDREDA